MGSMSEIASEMDSLENEAVQILANSNLTSLERRLAMEQLLRRYRVLDEYRRALAAYLARMRQEDGVAADDPEDVIDEILASPEFSLVRLGVFIALLAVIYGGGPRSNLLPVALLAMMMRPVPVRIM